MTYLITLADKSFYFKCENYIIIETDLGDFYVGKGIVEMMEKSLMLGWSFRKLAQ